MPNVSGTWYGLPVPGPATGQVIDFGIGDLPPVPAIDVGDALELSGELLHRYIDEVCAFSYQSQQAAE